MIATTTGILEVDCMLRKSQLKSCGFLPHLMLNFFPVFSGSSFLQTESPRKSKVTAMLAHIWRLAVNFFRFLGWAVFMSYWFLQHMFCCLIRYKSSRSMRCLLWIFLHTKPRFWKFIVPLFDVTCNEVKRVKVSIFFNC